MSELDYLVKRDGTQWVVTYDGDPVDWFETQEGAELAAQLYQEGADPDAEL